MFARCTIVRGIEEWETDGPVSYKYTYNAAADVWGSPFSLMSKTIAMGLEKMRTVYLIMAPERAWQFLITNHMIYQWERHMIGRYVGFRPGSTMCAICHIGTSDYNSIETSDICAIICDRCPELLRATTRQIQYAQYLFLRRMVDHRDVQLYIMIWLRKVLS